MTTLSTQYNNYILNNNTSLTYNEWLSTVYNEKFINFMNAVTSNNDSENIRIYIDNILHIRIPRDKNIKLHSWKKTDTKLYYIEIWCVGHSEVYEYEDYNLWVNILSVLNKSI